ncbi:MAG: TonB-dependent receptor, partial [Pseudomonadota bacterium]
MSQPAATVHLPRRATLALAATVALALPAQAQSDPQQPVEEVVVTSFRQSVQNAIDVKRNADTVVEAISAQDIGRLPDISIAEALARLPGITSQRVNGQSSAINIRGLSQSLTFSTLNGREQVTPNGNRSIEFEQFPSELISGAEVYKSSKASLIEGGVAGTVELKTIRPLDRSDRIVNVNVRGSYNDRAGEIFDADEGGYRLSASYVDQNDAGTFGFALGYARLVQPDVSTRFVGFDYDNFAGTDFNGDGVNDNLSFGFENEEQGGTDTRDGIILTAQIAPNDRFSVELDGYYSRFESDSYGRGVRVIGPQSAPGSTSLDDAVVAGNAVVGGTFTRTVGAPTVDGGGFGLTFQNINDNQFDEDELLSIGTKFIVDNARSRATLDFTYSRGESFFANEVSNILALTSLDGGVPGISNNLPNTPVLFDGQQVSVNYNGTDLPDIAFGPGNDFTDRSTAFLSNFGAFPFENEDELFAVAGDLEFDVEFGGLRGIQVGARYSTRDAEQFRESAGGGFGNDAGFFQFAGQPFTPIALTEANSSVNCFSGDFADNGFPCYLVIEDPRALFESENGPIELNQNEGFTRDQSFTVSEDVVSAYVMGNLDLSMGSTPVTGNVGVRLVHTDQTSANQAAEGSALAQVGEQDYLRVLPSLNLVFGLTDRDLLRFGASRTITRPGLFSLGAGVGLSITLEDSGLGDGTLTPRLSGGGQGNPALEPFLSNNLDISFEHYFDNGGVFTVAAFYKDLETFIVTETVTDFDFAAEGFLPGFADLDNGDVLFDEAVADALGVVFFDDSFIGEFTAPVNGEGGFIYGLEIGYSQAFDFLPAPWNGFGITANYSYTDSEIDFTASNSGESLTLPLPGLSDHVANATVYYEVGGFSARVGTRYRSEFVSPQVGIDAQLPFTDSEFVVDFQSSYEFTAGALAGMT